MLRNIIIIIMIKTRASVWGAYLGTAGNRPTWEWTESGRVQQVGSRTSHLCFPRPAAPHIRILRAFA